MSITAESAPSPDPSPDDFPVSYWHTTAAVVLALGIMAGAFGAHGLKESLSAEMLAIWQTGARYHIYHAFGLFVVHQLRSSSANPRRFDLVGNLLFAGLFLFSGSLYILAITGARWLGAVTPLGGACWIAGWLLLAVITSKESKSKSEKP